MKYRIKDGFTIRQIAGTWVAVPNGSRATDTSVLVTMSDTAVFLWNLLIEEIGIDQMIMKITTEYEIDEQTAQKDLDRFLMYLNNNNLLEELSR